MLLAGVAILIAPSALAADSASATPSRVAPGALVSLVFTLDANATATLDVQQEVECILVSPSGEAPCGAATRLVGVHVAGAAGSYAFHLAAPDEPGLHEVRFARASAVGASLPPAQGATGATTSFEVVLPETEPALDLERAGDVATATSDATLGGGGARWLASTFMAAGAMAACVAATRRDGGP